MAGPSVGAKACGHAGCKLVSKICCFCADRRELTPDGYIVYHDGVGDEMTDNVST